MNTYFQTYLSTHRDDVDAFCKIPSLPDDINSSQQLVVSIFHYNVLREMILAIDRMDLIRLDCNCPKMIASDEWHFLCAPHSEKPRDCSALDYMKHTIDSTTSLLLSQPFVSKHYYSILRRLYRIYGHLYFHHYEIFKREKFHCIRFYLFLKEWGLFKQDMMIIPESALAPDPIDINTVMDLWSSRSSSSSSSLVINK